MGLHFNFFNILILAGCVQGIILGFLLFFMPPRSHSHFFLGMLLLTYSLDTLNAVFFDTTLSRRIPALLIAPFSLILAIGPALYLHTRYTLRPSTVFRRIDLLHFLPATIEFLWYVFISLFFWGKPNAIRLFYHGYESWYSLPEQIAGILSVFIYLILTLRLLKVQKQQLKDVFSAIEGLTYKGLSLLTVCLGIGWLIWLVLITIDTVYFNFSLGEHVYYPLYIVMSATIYAIGYSGYFRKIIVIEDFAKESLPAASEPVLEMNPELKAIAIDLQFLMQKEQLYLEPTLRLKAVAERLSCAPQKLSAALNGVLKKNFYDFVNEYRVQEVQRKLADPVYDQWTLTAVAYECGFNSKSTFNNIFKKITGTTPKEYKNSAKKDVREIQPDVSEVANS
jgi:AraC-like DNA-binding protein